MRQSSSVYKQLLKPATFFLMILLMIGRTPHLFLEPRFWAEEGTQFFRYAQCHDFWESLFFLQKNSGGYFNLPATFGSTLAASIVPLDLAPFATTYLAFFIQLVPFVIILFGNSYVWDNTLKKCLACILILLTPVVTGEVWLNTINAQVHCGLIALCLLVEDLRKAPPGRITIYAGLLFLCGISGPYTTFLFPAFLCKFLKERSRGTNIIVCISLLTSCIQGTIFVLLRFQNEISQNKFAPIEFGRSALNIVYYHILTPIFGNQYSYRIANATPFQAIREGEKAFGALELFPIVLFSGIILLIAYLCFRSRAHMVIALIFLSVLTTIGSVGCVPGGRYAVVPGVAFLLIVFDNMRFCRGWRSWSAALSSLLILSSVAFGAAGYRSERRMSYRSNCPAWGKELAKWRSDTNYRLRICPVNPNRPNWIWSIKLCTPQ